MNCGNSDLDDTFDELLAQSSLGAPNTRAIRARAPEHVVDTIQNRVDIYDA